MIKRILLSQPEPTNENSPYLRLSKNLKVSIDFIPFIQVEGISAIDVRKSKINIKAYTSIIFTSKNAVNHYFRVAEEGMYEVPEDNRYFCTTEAVANYLQKHTTFRKRRVFVGGKNIEDLEESIKKNKNEHYLLVTSDVLNADVPAFLDKMEIKWRRGVFYKTVSSNLSEVDVNGYDMLVFFTPSGVKSLFENYPDFKQGDMLIAVFGENTKAEAELNGLRIDLTAPSRTYPSMTMAIEARVSEVNKIKLKKRTIARYQ